MAGSDSEGAGAFGDIVGEGVRVVGDAGSGEGDVGVGRASGSIRTDVAAGSSRGGRRSVSTSAVARARGPASDRRARVERRGTEGEDVAGEEGDAGAALGGADAAGGGGELGGGGFLPAVDAVGEGHGVLLE